MAAFRVHKPRQHPAEILLRRRHAEGDAFRRHLLEKLLQVGDAEAELDGSRGGSSPTPDAGQAWFRRSQIRSSRAS